MKVIPFPKEETDQVRNRIDTTGIVSTTRVEDEFGKYDRGQRYQTTWGDTLEVTGVACSWRSSDGRSSGVGTELLVAIRTLASLPTSCLRSRLTSWLAWDFLRDLPTPRTSSCSCRTGSWPPWRAVQ